MRKLALLCGCAALAVAGVSGRAAHAQRADENAVTAAEDAFGTKVGNENVGLYNPNSARGFNPQLAGNMRIEGLYFDQQAFLGRAINRTTTMRVGLSAQSYPFLAPTGIADTALNAPDGSHVISVSSEFRRPTGFNGSSIDYKTPLSDTLSAQFVVSENRPRSDGGSHGQTWNSSVILRWKPSENFEALPFAFYQRGVDAEVAPSVFTGGAYLPPVVDRKVFYGQEWADRDNADFNGGIVARGNAWDSWRLQAGIFRSVTTRKKNYVVFYRNTQPSGAATLDVLKYPLHQSGSTSGEVRASNVVTTGSFRHTVHLAVRARETKRIFGGGNTVNLGAAILGVERAVAQPNFNLGIRDQDVVNQVTPGVSYVGQWAGVGEFSVGLQRSLYRREFGKIGAVPALTKSSPWLYNTTLNYNVTPTLAVYGGYTRGLEEFGTAPEGTVNAGQPLAAEMTKQIDGGIRYRIMPGLTLMAGVFEVKKPYFDRNPTNVYSVVGGLTHRGIEFSLTGRPFTGLTLVAGAVFLQARVSGLPVDQGLIGEVPPGTPPSTIRISAQYSAPNWRGFTLEGQVDSEGSHFANRTNTLKVASLTMFTVGARYPFAIGDVRANIRSGISNVTDKFTWTVDGNSGRFAPSQGRQFFTRVTVDF